MINIYVFEVFRVMSIIHLSVKVSYILRLSTISILIDYSSSNDRKRIR